MANAIESELLEATGLKKKVGETFQKLAARLVGAVAEMPEDEWDKLSDEAQAWHNAGSKAINANKDVARFPADEEPAGEPDEPEEKPARGRGRASRDEEEEPADEEPEEKPARGRRRAAAEEEEPEEKPARGRRRAAAEEEEPEDKPARTRTRSRATEEEEPEDKPARRTAAKETKPAGRAARKDPDAKGPSGTTLLKKMLIKDPAMKTDAILAELDEKHGLTMTPMACSSIRSAFIHSMKILDKAGHLSEKMAAKLE